MDLTGRRVVLGVCGGVAAYKSVELCRRLMDAGTFVSPILTDSAARFVGPATFAALASEPPRMSLWDAPEPSPHTALGQSADLIVVAPATARLIGSLAHGLSDDLLATTLLATRAPVVVCPAMHTEMWDHSAVKANMDLLRSRGVVVVDPEVGHLAGGDQGIGRLASIDAILGAIAVVLEPAKPLAGKRVLVTAGGTRESIDPVRFLGNRSSGKQGFALARAALDEGAFVTLISTTDVSILHRELSIRAVETAADMHTAVMHYLPEADVVIMAAAVADFRPTHVADHKLKKSDGVPAIALEPTDDVLAAVAQKRRSDQVIVGFAAETQNLSANATTKLNEKKLDLIVANDVSAEGAGFGHDTNHALIVGAQGESLDTGLVTKDEIATAVLRQVAQLMRQIDAGKANS